MSVFENHPQIEELKHMVETVTGDERRKSRGRVASGEDLLL